MKIICTICARGGSKGVKNKNLKELLGKPLIAWTIEQAITWGKADAVVVSTDSKEIAKVARQYGAEVPFTRPAQLSTDSAAKLPVIQHAVEYMEELNNEQFDYIIDLDPTSPLRWIEDVDRALQKLIKDPTANNLYTVTAASKSPYFNMVELDEEGYSHLSKPTMSPVQRRQDAPPVYEMNASIYCFRREYLQSATSVHSNKTLIYEMPGERSVDIDTDLDFKLVELLFKDHKEAQLFKEYKDQFNLRGKVAVVTGAEGLLGKEMVKGLVEHGAAVIAADIVCDEDMDLPKELTNKAYYVFLDVTDPSSVNKMISRLDRIDVWVNNAYPRTVDWSAKFEDVTFESFKRNVDMQMNSCFLCSQVVAEKMKAQMQGVIINTGSIYGLVGPNFDIYEGTEMTTPVAYSAIKGGIINLSRYLAAYLGKYNIRVNTLCPGGIHDDQPETFVKNYSKNTPLGRMGNPDDLVGPLVFLASDASMYMTGQTLVIDGGWTVL